MALLKSPDLFREYVGRITDTRGIVKSVAERLAVTDEGVRSSKQNRTDTTPALCSYFLGEGYAYQRAAVTADPPERRQVAVFFTPGEKS